MLNADEAALVVIDVQGKLARLMYERESLFENLAKLIQGTGARTARPGDRAESGRSGPDGSRDCRAASGGACCEGGLQLLRGGGLRGEAGGVGAAQLLLAGIEAHICVCQTAVDLVGRGYDVSVVADAVSSRTGRNRDIGLERMKAAGAGITSVETALFELLKVAEGEKFKAILRLVK